MNRNGVIRNQLFPKKYTITAFNKNRLFLIGHSIRKTSWNECDNKPAKQLNSFAQQKNAR